MHPDGLTHSLCSGLISSLNAVMGKSGKRQCRQQGFGFVSWSCGTCVLFCGASALSFRVRGGTSRA